VNKQPVKMRKTENSYATSYSQCVNVDCWSIHNQKFAGIFKSKTLPW